MTDQNAVVSAELARRDLEDIISLKNSEAFNRYWLRCLKQKRQTIDTAFRTDPGSKCDAVQREAYRQILIQYDELLEMMDKHEGNIKQRGPIQAPPMV